MPNFDDSGTTGFGDPETLIDLACSAEAAGWDGFFLWDHIQINREWKPNIVDPWVTLGAIAVKTTKIKIGTLISPLPRRRPWKLAREVVTLDHLSKGRVILGVGLGAPVLEEFAPFGETTENKIRAEKLDESLEILKGLFTGEPFSYEGKHYLLDNVCFRPRPYQEILPIWVGGMWPNKKPFRRAVKYEGVMPSHKTYPNMLTRQDYRDMIEYLKTMRPDLDEFDIVGFGELIGTEDEQAASIEEWKELGATWYIENIDTMRAEFSELEEIIKAGPVKK